MFNKEKMMDFLDEHDDVAMWYPTGSNYVCDPPVTNTDIDYVVLVANKNIVNDIADELGALPRQEAEQEMQYPNKKTPTMEFYPIRVLPNHNLIFVFKYTYMIKWIVATNLAKSYNLKKKSQRIALFREIFDNFEFEKMFHEVDMEKLLDRVDEEEEEKERNKLS